MTSPLHHLFLIPYRQLHKEEAARNEVEAKLHAANETLEETEKQISTVTAQKDGEIYRLSEEVTPKVNTLLLFSSLFFLLSQFLFPPICVYTFFFLPFFFPTYSLLCLGPSLLIFFFFV